MKLSETDVYDKIANVSIQGRNEYLYGMLQERLSGEAATVSRGTESYGEKVKTSIYEIAKSLIKEADANPDKALLFRNRDPKERFLQVEFETDTFIRNAKNRWKSLWIFFELGEEQKKHFPIDVSIDLYPDEIDFISKFIVDNYEKSFFKRIKRNPDKWSEEEKEIIFDYAQHLYSMMYKRDILTDEIRKKIGNRTFEISSKIQELTDRINDVMNQFIDSNLRNATFLSLAEKEMLVNEVIDDLYERIDVWESIGWEMAQIKRVHPWMNDVNSNPKILLEKAKENLAADSD